MTDRTVDLDGRRGMAAQKATELRRLSVEVQVDQAALQAQEDALETMLAATPAAGWPEAIEKARYLLGLFARSPGAQDPRRRRLVADVLADFDRLLDDPAPSKPATAPLFPGAPRARATTGDETMANKGDKRGNREAKKPKQEKAAPAAPASPFVATGKTGAASKPSGGKK